MTEYPRIPGVPEAAPAGGRHTMAQKLREWADKLDALPFEITGFAYIAARSGQSFEIVINDVRMSELEFYKYVYSALLEASRAPQGGFINTGGF